MEYTKSVSISGYVLSSMLYGHNSSVSDQEGFLIGDVIIRQTESISDNQLSQKKEETIINIYSHVPCDDVYSFYAYNCDIDSDKLHYYLQEKIQDVVGWYRYRRHSPVVMSLREKNVHKNLMAAFPRGNNFAFGLFSSYISENCATHTYDHAFFLPNSMREGYFEPVALNIVNLEDTSRDEYRLFPRAPVNVRSGTYSEVISHREEDQVLESVLLSEDINTVLLDKIEGLVEQVGSEEAEIGFLALDIKELEEKISKYMPFAQTISSDEEVAAYLSINENLVVPDQCHEETGVGFADKTCRVEVVCSEEVCSVVQKESNVASSPPPHNDDNSKGDGGCARARHFLKKDPDVDSNDKSC